MHARWWSSRFSLVFRFLNLKRCRSLLHQIYGRVAQKIRFGGVAMEWSTPPPEEPYSIAWTPSKPLGDLATQAQSSQEHRPLCLSASCGPPSLVAEWAHSLCICTMACYSFGFKARCARKADTRTKLPQGKVPLGCCLSSPPAVSFACNHQARP